MTSHSGQREHVVILGCAQSGALRLQQLLSRYVPLACTSGTGVLKACEQAASAWRELDAREGPLSRLAAASIRAMTDCMITSILASAGQPRWCEVSFAPAWSAEAFLELYPTTRFVCLHRSCADIIAAVVQAHPWGLAGTPFAAHAAGFPANTVAAIAQYWASQTTALLAFERAHPAACCRVIHEHVSNGQSGPTDELGAFLGFDPRGPAYAPGPAAGPGLADEKSPPAGGELLVPADRIPPALRSQVNDLLGLLGQRPLS